MKIESILVKDNEFMDSGKLDEQIINDFEQFIKQREDYQINRLDAICKEESPHHYEMWTKQNQAKIIYAKRIVECVKMAMN